MDMEMSTLLLVLGRLSPLFLLSSLTPFAWVPLIVRVILACASTLMVGSFGASAGTILDPTRPLPFVMALLCEVAAGVSLAIALVVPGAAIGFSARLIDVQSGMASASLLNPMTHVDESLVQSIMRWASSAAFFSMGIHREAMRLFIASFEIAPAGGVHAVASPHAFMLLLSSQFVLGLLIAAPIVVGLFVVDVVIAFLSRSMPQANIYFVALPLKLAASIVLIALTLRNVPAIVVGMYRDAFGAFAHGVP